MEHEQLLLQRIEIHSSKGDSAWDAHLLAVDTTGAEGEARCVAFGMILLSAAANIEGEEVADVAALRSLSKEVGCAAVEYDF